MQSINFSNLYVKEEAIIRSNIETVSYTAKIASIAALVVSVATVFFSLLTAPAGTALLLTLINAPIIAFSIDGILASRAALAIIEETKASLHDQLVLAEEEDFAVEDFQQFLMDRCIEKALAATFLTRYLLPSEGYCKSQQANIDSWEKKLAAEIDTKYLDEMDTQMKDQDSIWGGKE